MLRLGARKTSWSRDPPGNLPVSRRASPPLHGHVFYKISCNRTKVTSVRSLKRSTERSSSCHTVRCNCFRLPNSEWFQMCQQSVFAKERPVWWLRSMWWRIWREWALWCVTGVFCFLRTSSDSFGETRKFVKKLIKKFSPNFDSICVWIKFCVHMIYMYTMWWLKTSRTYKYASVLHVCIQKPNHNLSEHFGSLLCL